MNRSALWTTLVLLGLAVAIVDLFTGWTVRFGPAALVVLLGLACFSRQDRLEYYVNYYT